MNLDPHQRKAIKCLKNVFKENNRTLLKMFCGTGKTGTMNKIDN